MIKHEVKDYNFDNLQKIEVNPKTLNASTSSIDNGKRGDKQIIRGTIKKD